MDLGTAGAEPVAEGEAGMGLIGARGACPGCGGPHDLRALLASASYQRLRCPACGLGFRYDHPDLGCLLFLLVTVSFGFGLSALFALWCREWAAAGFQTAVAAALYFAVEFAAVAILTREGRPIPLEGAPSVDASATASAASAAGVPRVPPGDASVTASAAGVPRVPPDDASVTASAAASPASPAAPAAPLARSFSSRAARLSPSIAFGLFALLALDASGLLPGPFFPSSPVAMRATNATGLSCTLYDFYVRADGTWALRLDPAPSGPTRRLPPGGTTTWCIEGEGMREHGFLATFEPTSSAALATIRREYRLERPVKGSIEVVLREGDPAATAPPARLVLAGPHSKRLLLSIGWLLLGGLLLARGGLPIGRRIDLVASLLLAALLLLGTLATLAPVARDFGFSLLVG